MTNVTGLGDFQRIKSEADEVEIAGNKIKVMGLDDLIRAKEVMGRDKDKLAVRELKAIRAKKTS